MAFTLRESPYGGTVPMYSMTAANTIVKGNVVKIAAGNATVPVRVDPITGGAASVERPYGVAVSNIAQNTAGLIIPILPGMIWEADSVAISDGANCGEMCILANAGYVDVANKAATTGTRANLGTAEMVQTLDVVYTNDNGAPTATCANKYLVQFDILGTIRA